MHSHRLTRRCLLACTGASVALPSFAAEPEVPMPSFPKDVAEALGRLKDGNQRFADLAVDLGLSDNSLHDRPPSTCSSVELFIRTWRATITAPVVTAFVVADTNPQRRDNDDNDQEDNVPVSGA